MPEVTRRDAAARPRWRRVARLVVAATAAGAAGLTLVLVGSEPPPEQPPTVHAERSGLRLGTQALSGRVALVASDAGLRWRIEGVTQWHHARGRMLIPSWDTTRWPDGAYRLELVGRSHRRQTLVIRNYTALRPSLIANASAGLGTRSTDARAVVASLARRSYRPGDVAVLKLWTRLPSLQIELLRVGPEWSKTAGDETLKGVAVGRPIRAVGRRGFARFRIGDWQSGVYTARLTAPGKVGFAPFVVRPRRLGSSRVAVVQPTNTWQAYNYRCADGDGVPDTWYFTNACASVHTSRPYLDRGVPPHFRQYDLGFLHWLARTRKHVDMLAQEDLERVSGERLARLYDLIVFPGHHEYVTEAEYDAVQRYRDLGGNLAFLSANNFFYRVNRYGDRITRIGLWRDLGRPEAALVGVQYFSWNVGTYRSRQYVVRGADLTPWLFAGTGIGNGDRLGWWGIEVDGRTSSSPQSVRVIATIPNAFGTGRPAEMTYYETRSGARVFAAGAFTLAGGQAERWTTSRLLANLWERLAGRTARPNIPPGTTT